MSTNKWRGVFPAVTTKFKDNEDLDYAEMEKHYAFQIDSGVHGLVTCGSLGEASTLSFYEKLEVTKIALQVADKRLPVLVNVSETRTSNALRFVEQAADMGVQGLMVMPSVLYAADAREAKDNLRAIAKAAQLPIMVYNNPVTYKVDLTPEDFLDLADCEWLVAIKESTDNIRRITDLRNVLGDRYQLFMGVDDLSFEGLAVGADGLLAGLVVAFPKETVALYNMMQARLYDDALKLYQWFMPLLHLDVSNKLVQNLKLVETLVGVGNENVRRPRQPLVGAERERVTTIVQKALATRPDVSIYL
ncbi:dihydrodipicolinate synthase family protein [Undibacterium sp. RTI2.1]|uniref:dihydrodipicolinate synthase family protein n=1 Tax=unclassified Undibacterium TaxID=2630295 RepID=UPI002AB4308D|nr:MULTISPECIES: dihydrodipicolinate synthase family protein [unclassified Undibacterium]MDY7538720.1 dihydrodipicolinate synthase family protein [Undibacterium sp. 5I1]MEB0030224.1 dihydrodipicolinate synthase family protein [Undibacterium sp. RTI2.1]MEB0116848.1 dihydrodipicolinate synthase family protein [Undibacterium sp. RTI2.2]MEB0229659.1 dihydrodipicolinate synthase family protein [Undibacterium sp. 10I3]MEB0259350.1 dihydrodipicolinate synthase family protein [Undibacterium sp. 5I1]